MLLPSKVTRRVGNWCEESVLREEKLREFLSKIESGEVGFKRRERRTQLALMPTKLSPALVFDQNIMILNAGTKGFLAVDIPEHFPDLKDQDTLPVTTTRNIGLEDPKARATFQLERKFDLGSHVDQRLRYGEKFYIRINLPDVTQTFYLASELRTTSNFHGSQRQRVYMTTIKDYNAVWQYDWVDSSYDLEMEGKPVDPFVPGIIKHAQTGNNLGNDPQRKARGNDFNGEWVVDCHIYRDYTAKLMLDNNIFVMCVARNN